MGITEILQFLEEGLPAWSWKEGAMCLEPGVRTLLNWEGREWKSLDSNTTDFLTETKIHFS